MQHSCCEREFKTLLKQEKKIARMGGIKDINKKRKIYLQRTRMLHKYYDDVELSTLFPDSSCLISNKFFAVPVPQEAILGLVLRHKG